ncbi:hypothetical protein AAHA92_00667 [Salvia divinorum]|uniref:Uncharacterized protein n=1 Tax=Salvia divinorum TaxID=28513 RepID=A0ABD1IKC5_SALDI
MGETEELSWGDFGLGYYEDKYDLTKDKLLLLIVAFFILSPRDTVSDQKFLFSPRPNYTSTTPSNLETPFHSLRTVLCSLHYFLSKSSAVQL